MSTFIFVLKHVCTTTHTHMQTGSETQRSDKKSHPYTTSVGGLRAPDIAALLVQLNVS